MEETVGQIWHRWVTRAADQEYPDARVTLDEVRQSAGMVFRALGGAPGLQLLACNETEHGARRSLLQRMAGTDQHVELAWCDAESLRLPTYLACFPDAALNRELYLWLAALASEPPAQVSDWLPRNMAACHQLLQRLPGLKARYDRLLDAHLSHRPKPANMKGNEAVREGLIQQALRHPEAESPSLPVCKHAPMPVPLWLHPNPPPVMEATDNRRDEADADTASEAPPLQPEADDAVKKRRRGERVENPDGRDGLLAFRLESMFSRAEYVAVDRSTENDEDTDVRSAADDLSVLSMANDASQTTSRFRLDLDLPSEAHDDLPLDDGILYPEWDFKKGVLQADRCRVISLEPRNAEPAPLPTHLRFTARRVQRNLAMLKPKRTWQRGMPEGSELDLEAVVAQRVDAQRGLSIDDARVFKSFNNTERDLASLLLADLSMSTDAYINDHQRGVDVIRDSLYLFSEALESTGDRFALHGFSSRRREHVRFHVIKRFDEAHTDVIRGRIDAMRPGYYTRMGAAIRHASHLLEREPASQRLLLLLSDGKPNDLDRYESRYGIEDTRAAINEARRLGLQPFCVTIDSTAGDYLPYLFGSNGYVLVRHARELPARLPLVYARLTV